MSPVATSSDKNCRPYVISMDWLSLSCNTTAAFFPDREEQPSGYRIKPKGNGTKMWACMADVYEPNGQQIGTLTWQPRSPVIRQDSAILKIDNNILYEADAVDRACAAVIALGLKFRCINRLDVAYDCNLFYGGLTPRNFISRIDDGQYLKVGLTHAYAYRDMTYHAQEVNGQLLAVTPNLSEAEEEFIRRVRAKIRQPKALSAFAVDNSIAAATLSESEALANLRNLAKATADDTPEDAAWNIMLTAYIYTLVPGLACGEFARKAWLIVRNKVAQTAGLQPKDFIPTKPLTARPHPRTESLTFGRAGKAIQVQIYNKTKELREVHMKKYIVDTWQRAGLDIDDDVWRVEIRIASAGQELQNLENRQMTRLTCNDILTQAQIEEVFFAYAEKYFKFYRFDPDIVKVQNMPRLQLFCMTQRPLFRPKRIKKQCNPTRFTRVMVSQLNKAIQDAQAINSPFYTRVLCKARDFYAHMYDFGMHIEEIKARSLYEAGQFVSPETPAEHAALLYAGSTDGHRLYAVQQAKYYEERSKKLKKSLRAKIQQRLEDYARRCRENTVNWENLSEQTLQAARSIPDPGRLELDYAACFEALMSPIYNTPCPF